MKRIDILLVALSFLFVCACGGGGGGGSQTALTPSDLGWIIPETDPNNITTLPSGEEISSELISISVKDGISREEVEKIADGIGGIIAGEMPDINAYYIKFSPPKTAAEIEAIVSELRTNPSIDTASPEFIYEFTGTIPSSTDIETTGLLTNEEKWGFNNTNIPQAWKAIRESGRNLSDIVVAVIDSGFDLDHPDLKDNFILESNGHYAWDFGDEDSDVSYDFFSYTPEGKNYSGHGTQICGIIASAINGEGINGVSPTAKIFPLKCWPSLWGARWNRLRGEEKVPQNAIAFSFLWAIHAKADVINLSYGGRYTLDEYRQTPKYKIIRVALNRGIIVVAAAGNEGEDASYNFPSAMESIIAVGAIDSSNQRSEWPLGGSSNWSDSPNALWIAAPGSGVYTTDISGYKEINGTSIAAPFVSGLAALMKQVNPSLTNTEVANIIRETGDDIIVSYPDDSEHTWKKMNAAGAINRVLEMVKVNTPPQISNVSISGIGAGDGGTGDITITYDLSDVDGDICSISTEYQGGSAGIIWTTATISGITSEIAPASNKSVIWKSALDEAGNNASNYKIRIIPNDGTNIGTAGTSAVFTVNNGPLIIPESCDDSYEPNGSFAQAIYLTSSQGGSGYEKQYSIDSFICSPLDIDYFKISVKNRVTMLAVSEAEIYYGKDYDIYLYDSSYREIGRSANRPLGGGIEAIFYNTEYLDPIPQGTYYIKVVGYSGAYAVDKPYSLSIMFTYY